MKSIKVMWIIISAILVTGLFLAGYGLGTIGLGQEVSKNSGNFKAGYVAGLEAAKKILNESGVLPPARQEIKSISGIVRLVDRDDKKIVISGAGRISPNPLEPQGPDERTIVITKNTVIKAQVPTSPADLKIAMEKFNQSTKDGTPSAPPGPYTEKIVTFDDIKLTMLVSVSSPMDIRNDATIEAETIWFTATPSTVLVK